MSIELNKVLESADWSSLKTEVANDFLTRVLLSSHKGDIASFYLDWNLKVIDKVQTKVDLTKFPLKLHKEDENG